MASWQAHLVSSLLRWTLKRQLARATVVEDVRALFNRGGGGRPPGVAVSEATVGGIRCEWVEPAGGGAHGTLLYLHGGGYVACSPRTHRPITGFFALRGFRVCVPDYRLAPENPFPAGLEDALAVYRELAARGPVVLAGDSAGGGLSLSLMLSLKERGLPQPAAAALFSPLTDLAARGNSLIRNEARCAMFMARGIASVAPAYIPGLPADTPLASPVYAELAGLPPLLVHVGGDEVLLDDSVRLAERARAAGVPVELKVWPVVPHCWQLFHRYIPEGVVSLTQAAAFLKDAAGRAVRAPAA